VADHARESDMAEVVRRALDRLPHGHGEKHGVTGGGEAAH